MAVSSTSYQEAHATDINEVMIKMIQVNSNLSDLKNVDTNFDKLTMGKTSFKIKQIQDSLLEINKINDRNNDNVNKIYEYLKINYNTELEKYQKNVILEVSKIIHNQPAEKIKEMYDEVKDEGLPPRQGEESTEDRVHRYFGPLLQHHLAQ
ncbi:MAG: hypothetical protein IIC15_06820 [Thaumarchaeota archaeon]|nr:hypothetical protein [Nitrososphaerota archaeon]